MGHVKESTQSTISYKQDKSFVDCALFCPMYISQKQVMTEKNSHVYLIDKNGDVVHCWNIPGLLRFYAELLPNGNILCTVERSNDLSFNTSIIMELDWDSNVVWERVASA